MKDSKRLSDSEVESIPHKIKSPKALAFGLLILWAMRDSKRAKYGGGACDDEHERASLRVLSENELQRSEDKIFA
ncbi:hypothetical protein KKC45_01665 [Patescibacteria group bacterium]|nr:hypothetical protein [Patescibacteria group bacterium]